MVRYYNKRDLQTLSLFRDGVEVKAVTSQDFCDALYRRLCSYRFFTHHRIERVTTRQFLAMLAAARLNDMRE